VGVKRRVKKPSSIAGRGLLVLAVGALVGGVLVTAAPAGAVPSVLYVDRNNPGCADTGPGTPTQPLCSIKAAGARAIAGTTVIVSTGTYIDQVTVSHSGTPAEPIVFMPAAGASVTISGPTYGFRLSSKAWVTIKGFNITGTTSHGIYVSDSANITLDGNHVTLAGQPISGLVARGISLKTTTSSLVVANVTDHNTDAGIFLGTGCSGVVLTTNLSFSNARQYTRAAAGIDVRSDGNTLEGNISHSNEDSGINVWDGADNTLAHNNLTMNNGDHGIDVKGSNGVRVLANTVYNNVDSGIEVVSSTGALLANDISVDNGINSPRTSGNIRVDAASTATISLDFDLVHLRTTGVMIDWAGTRYSSLAAFHAATGREPRGIEADPRFRLPGAGDLHLLAASPAIDSADSGASGQPVTDADGNGRVDDPATPDTGVGPRTFDDRGAYEFQP
jgi:parallel beta-helix repeat protein